MERPQNGIAPLKHSYERFGHRGELERRHRVTAVRGRAIGADAVGRRGADVQQTNTIHAPSLLRRRKGVRRAPDSADASRMPRLYIRIDRHGRHLFNTSREDEAAKRGEIRDG